MKHRPVHERMHDECFGWKAVAVILIMLALLMCIRSVVRDRVYELDNKYLEDNQDSVVVDCFNLKAGSYTLIIDYEISSNVNVTIQADNDNVFDMMLDMGSKSMSSGFRLTHPTDRFKIVIPRDEGVDVQINSIRIKSRILPIYYDSLLYAIVLIIFAYLTIVMSTRWQRFAHEDKFTILTLLIFALVVNIPYFKPELGFTDDIRAHMQRIQGLMTGLADRQFPVVVSPNMLNEFGEISFLYPDIFLYPFSILRLAGVSMYTSYRLCMISVNILTIVIAYASFRLMYGCKSRRMILFFTAVITFEPYRLYNILGRGSGAGNAIASAFFPLVIAGMYLILRGDKKWWILSFGITGVLRSHVLSMVILIPVLLVAGLVFAFKLVKEGTIRLLIRAAALTLIMNLAFLIIFFKCYMMELNFGALEWSDFTGSGFDITGTLTNPWSLFEIIALVICVLLLIRYGKRDLTFFFSAVMTLVGALLYISSWKIFPWSEIISIVPGLDFVTLMLQMPQRMYAISSVLFVSVMALCTGSDFPAKSSSGRRREFMLLSGLIICTILYGSVYEYVRYFSLEPLMPDEVYGDYNTLPLKDYIPMGADESSWSSDTGYVSDEENVESLYYRKLGTHIDYEYIAHTGGTYAVFPLLYFDGYRASDEQGTNVAIRKTKEGRVAADLLGDGMPHQIHVHYNIGVIYDLLYIISLILDVGIVLFLIKGECSFKSSRD